MITEKNEKILDRLITLAGKGQIIRDALKQLNYELPNPPTIEQLVERIILLRNSLLLPTKKEC